LIDWSRTTSLENYLRGIAFMNSVAGPVKQKRVLTRDNLIGMQVINCDGYILGNVKEVALVLGEPDQAITIEGSQGRLNYIRWSNVAVAGDVILLKAGGVPPADAPAVTQSFAQSYMPPVAQSVAQPVAQPVAQACVCPKCGAELENGCAFCTGCGCRIKV
jgi:sporulation protein YlmC with PRC-barrel domain